jgi:hypothetical protein
MEEEQHLATDETKDNMEKDKIIDNGKPAVLLCRRTPTYYGRIVVKILYTPAPIKNCATFKNVCIHQCVQRCVYMYIQCHHDHLILHINAKNITLIIRIIVLLTEIVF